MNDSDIIINIYNITEDLIIKNPQDEDKIINDYINFIIKFKNNKNINKTYIRSSTYNNYPNIPSNNSHHDTIKKNISFSDYFSELSGGFKEYFTFKN